jgi:hypothetical protein
MRIPVDVFYCLTAVHVNVNFSAERYSESLSNLEAPGGFLFCFMRFFPKVVDHREATYALATADGTDLLLPVASKAKGKCIGALLATVSGGAREQAKAYSTGDRAPLPRVSGGAREQAKAYSTGWNKLKACSTASQFG